ncbi:MAG: hypothetical protein OXG84_04815, partial [Chloroflexi bacterium]|nr:hypothetical protein [Chloroflexota bacterium]
DLADSAALPRLAKAIRTGADGWRGQVLRRDSSPLAPAQHARRFDAQYSIGYNSKERNAIQEALCERYRRDIVNGLLVL